MSENIRAARYFDRNFEDCYRFGCSFFFGHLACVLAGISQHLGLHLRTPFLSSIRLNKSRDPDSSKSPNASDLATKNKNRST